MARFSLNRPGRDPAPPAAPFIVGVARSGTTLLRLMLDAHPELAIPPETNFLPELIELTRGGGADPEAVTRFIVDSRRWGDFNLDADELSDRLSALRPLSPSSAARAFYRLYADKQGKPRWGDKSPRYARRMVRITQHLPEARFIHIIRDGRDVALSRLGRRRDDPEAVREAAVKWRRRIERARHRADRVPYLEIRFEGLIADTQATLREVCAFADLPWRAEILDYHRQSADRLTEMADALPAREGKERRASEDVLLGRRAKRHQLVTAPPTPERLGVWREQMTPDCLAAFDQEAGPLLADLGYERR
jgi:hypothetical protein